MAKESTQSSHKTSASRTTSKTAAKRNTSAKTQPTMASVAAFIAAVDGDERRADCQTVLQLMKAASKSEPVMWGSSIIGFGCYRYQ